MSRPQKQTVEYFSHDAVAGQGRTLSILYNHFGHEGISAWWLLLETLARTRNHSIALKNSEDTEFLAAQMHFPPERLTAILSKMAELESIDPDLFKSGIIWCQHFVDRLEPIYKSRKQDLPMRPFGKETPLSGKETPLSVPRARVPRNYTKETILKRVKKAATFEEYQDSLKPKYPAIDFDHEIEKFWLYWDSHDKKHTPVNKKLCLVNWMDKAAAWEREGRGNGQKGESHGRVRGPGEVPGNEPIGAFADVEDGT